MKPLSLDLIEQGRHMEEWKETIARGAEFLAGFIDQHGQAAAGAKVTLHATIILRVRPDGRRIEIRTAVRKCYPGRPSEITEGYAALLTDQHFAIVVPESGSDRDPHQAKLFSDDGRSLPGAS